MAVGEHDEGVEEADVVLGRKPEGVNHARPLRRARPEHIQNTSRGPSHYRNDAAQQGAGDLPSHRCRPFGDTAKLQRKEKRWKDLLATGSRGNGAQRVRF